MARPVGANIQSNVSTNAGDIVKQALKSRGYTQKMLAEILGYGGPNSVGMAINGRNMQINVLAMMLDALGFDLIIKDRNSSNKDNVWKLELQNTVNNQTEESGENK